MVHLLLSRGADPTQRGRHQRTPLMNAAIGGYVPGSDHVAVIRMLIRDGRVPVNARDCDDGPRWHHAMPVDHGRTALWWACRRGWTERARVLLMKGGADHTIADSRGRTPRKAALEPCGRLMQVSAT